MNNGGGVNIPFYDYNYDLQLLPPSTSTPDLDFDFNSSLFPHAPLRGEREYVKIRANEQIG